MCIIANRVCGCPPKKKPHQLTDGGGDRLSNLHSSIVAHILSRLPTEEAVRTCVLSKNWEFEWCSIYNVEISDAAWSGVHESHWEFPLTCIYEKIIMRKGLLNGKSATLADMMERKSLSHHVRSFTLFCWENKYDLGHMTKWISAVMGPNIETLRLVYPYQGLVLPQSLFQCISLRNLDLKLQCTLRVPSVVHCFSNLINLSLHSVEILNEDFNMDTLILKFKVLKTLKLYLCKWLNVKFVEIHAPALTTFKLDSRFSDREDDHSIKILGANLANFETRYGFNVVLTGSTIACANVDCWIILESHPQLVQVWKLLTELSSVEYLILKGNMIEAVGQLGGGLALPRYDRLERLDIDSCGELEGLLELLHVTPFLKILEIDMSCRRYDDCDDVETVPSCVISSLEEVKFKHYYYKDHQFELEKFLLSNGKQLKKVILALDSCVQRDEFVKQLSTFPRASSTSLDIVVIP